MMFDIGNFLICIIFYATSIHVASALVLLSDLPTPSFIIDTDALRRRIAPPLDKGNEKSKVPYRPSIRCPSNKLVLHPSTSAAAIDCSDEIVDCNFDVIEMIPTIGYLHTSVLRARENVITGEDDIATFLAEIDLVHPTLCEDAQLVLGLNNHHVGGYYWARSAGVGSGMEAPGVTFGSSSQGKGLLCWSSDGGPTECNSNDGKRSEWVNFLRKGDTVQLVPTDSQETLLQFSKQFGEQQSTTPRVYGISSHGRPMGSEPEVVCEYRFE